MNMVELLSGLNQETEVLLSLSIILFSGFIMTRLTNTLNMPKVSGYILAGILIGPCCFNFIPASMTEGMSFVSDLALAFIAFGVGKFFKKEVLMRTGKKIIVITITEALGAGVLVTLCLKVMFNMNWEFALILGAIATATAPASTMMTINQYKAKGEFVDTLLQIVALDDVVCLLAFSIVSAVINGNAAGSLSVNDILVPIAYNILVILFGVFCGYFLSRLLIPARSRDNRLILAIAMLLGLSGICAAIDISPLLSCMVFGAVYINLTKDKKLFRQINSFTPPVMSVFFIVSGMNLDVRALETVGAIGVSYFIIRIIGKYLGTYISCLVMKTSREIRNYMGLALIPQAGVAIGLAFLGQRMLPPETGSMMLTIILASSVLYEMVGPVSAKAALLLSGSIPYIGEKKKDEDAEGEETDAVQSMEEEADGAEEESDSAGEADGAEEEPDVTEEPDNAEEEPDSAGKGPDGAKGPDNAEEKSDVTGEPDSAGKEPDGAKEPGNAEKEPDFNREPGSTEGEQELAGESENEESAGKTDRGEKTGKGGKVKKVRKAVMSKSRIPEEKAEAEEEEAAEEEEDHAVLPELREYSKGVDERDDYDIERDIKPPKNKKKKKGKKAVKARKVS